MKRLAHLLVLGSCILLLPTLGRAQEVQGWDYAVLPAVSYNSDLGFHYGLFGNLYYYGRDSLCTYPQYRHMLGFEASRYTKGQTLLYLQYNGKELFPRTDVTVTARWQKDPAMQFWGYNGAYLFTDNYTDDFFLLDRQYLLINGGAETRLAGRFKAYLGIAFWNFRMHNPDSSATHDGTLLSVMRNNGYINDNEADGGSILDLKLGVLYDSRNHPTCPSRGHRVEAFLTRSVDLSYRQYNSLKLNAQILQFYPLGDIAVFANRTALQLLLLGEQPYYTLTTINTMQTINRSTEGLGGISTLRGMPLNALAADGFAWANTEVRIKIFKFNLLKRSFEVILNPFFDAGMPLRLYRDEASNGIQASRPQNSPYLSAGMGGKLVVNQNFVLTAEVGTLLNSSSRRFWGMNFSTGYTF